jgi:RES domain-containing protein
LDRRSKTHHCLEGLRPESTAITRVNQAQVLMHERLTAAGLHCTMELVGERKVLYAATKPGKCQDVLPMPISMWCGWTTPMLHAAGGSAAISTAVVPSTASANAVCTPKWPAHSRLPRQRRCLIHGRRGDRRRDDGGDGRQGLRWPVKSRWGWVFGGAYTLTIAQKGISPCVLLAGAAPAIHRAMGL